MYSCRVDRPGIQPRQIKRMAGFGLDRCDWRHQHVDSGSTTRLSVVQSVEVSDRSGSATVSIHWVSLRCRRTPDRGCMDSNCWVIPGPETAFAKLVDQLRCACPDQRCSSS